MDGSTIKAKAQYACETRRQNDPWYSTIYEDISVNHIESEKNEKTLERLREAARRLDGMYKNGCYRKKFTGSLWIKNPGNK